jgi:hypothetical protein
MKKSTKKHRVESLPEWAQLKLKLKDTAIEQLKMRLEGIEQAHAVLMGRYWFAVDGPRETDPVEALRDAHDLFLLLSNEARRVCSLYKGDLLLVGRQRPKKKPKEG